METDFEELLRQKLIQQYKAPKRKRIDVATLEDITELSRSTINRFMGYEASSSASSYDTLNRLAKSVGAEGWDDFCRKERQILEASTPAQPPQPEEIAGHEPATITTPAPATAAEGTPAETASSADEPELAPKRPRTLYLWGGLLLLISSVLAGYLVKHTQTNVFTAAEKQEFERIIDAANQTEFNLYKSLPLDSVQFNREVAKLDSFFTEDGTAKKIIIGGAQKALREQRKLRCPPSSYSKIDIQFKEKSPRQDSPEQDSPEQVKVETTEKWYLLWYDIHTNKDNRLFDTLNHHIYVLKNIQGIWKIHMDEYRGRPKKVMQ